jgi:hypothetical protein
MAPTASEAVVGKTGASTAFPYANHAGLPVWAEPETTRSCIIASVAMPVVAPEQCSCADNLQTNSYLPRSSQTITTADSSSFGPIVSKRQQKRSPGRAAASGSSWPENRRIFAHFRSEGHRPSDLYEEKGVEKDGAENPRNCPP